MGTDSAELEAMTATARANAREVERLEAELREAREALRDSARHHHDTITPSRLHDPEHVAFEECPAKTCVRARGVLEKGTGNTEHA